MRAAKVRRFRALLRRAAAPAPLQYAARPLTATRRPPPAPLPHTAAKAVVAVECYLASDGTVANLRVKRVAAPKTEAGGFEWLCPPTPGQAARAGEHDGSFCFRNSPAVGVVAKNLKGGIVGEVAFERPNGSSSSCGAAAGAPAPRGAPLRASAAPGRQLSTLDAACRAAGGLGRVAGAAFHAPRAPARGKEPQATRRELGCQAEVGACTPRGKACVSGAANSCCTAGDACVPPAGAPPGAPGVCAALAAAGTCVASGEKCITGTLSGKCCDAGEACVPPAGAPPGAPGVCATLAAAGTCVASGEKCITGTLSGKCCDAGEACVPPAGAPPGAPGVCATLAAAGTCVASGGRCNNNDYLPAPCCAADESCVPDPENADRYPNKGRCRAP